MNRLIVLFVSIMLFRCSTPVQRKLSEAEARQYGLIGVIHDAPLCPTVFKEGGLQVSGPCEYVTCEAEHQKVTCVARKLDCPPGLTCPKAKTH